MRVYGGPHDGAEINTRLPGNLLFCDGKRCYRAPGKGRSLYAVERMGDVYSLWYVHNAYSICSGCRVFHSRYDDYCSLCGGALEPIRAS